MLLKIITPKQINYNDLKTLKYINNGCNFYISTLCYEKYTPYQYYKSIKALTFEDLIIINALVLIERIADVEKYISLRNGELKLKTKLLSKQTKSTCGIFVFQEQILETIQYYTNWEFEQIDMMRKVLGKKMEGTQIENNFIACFKNRKKGKNVYQILKENCVDTVKRNYVEEHTKHSFFFTYCDLHAHESFYYHREKFNRYVNDYFK